MIHFTRMPSPIGPLLLVGDGESLTGLHMVTSHDRVELSGALEDPQAAPLIAARLQLEEYFSGTRRIFDLPLRLEGTVFQQRVWRALVSIPFGETLSYRRLAERIGNPKAMRAVGLANGRNPIAVIVPCHRVIGADGSLVGFGGGLERKRWLLAHEGAHPAPEERSRPEQPGLFA